MLRVGRTTSGPRRRAARLVALLVVVVALGATAGCDSGSADAAAETVTSLKGTVTVRPAERRVTVVLTEDLTAASTATATTISPETGAKAPLVRRTKVDARNDSFTIFLSRAPTTQVPVSWMVDGVKVPATDTSGTASGTTWTFISGLVLAFLVFGLVSMGLTIGMVKTQASGSVADRGLVFASYLKVSALIAISAIALIAIVIVAADNPNMSALFTLLGTIAGYLAGTKPRTEEDPPPIQAPAGTSAGPAGRSSRTLL